MSMFDHTATATTPTPTTAKKPVSKYGGIVGANTRDPMLELGTYRVRVIACEEGCNRGKNNRESYKVSLQVLKASPEAQTPAGAIVSMIALMTPAGMSELKRFAFHAAGFGPTLEQRSSPDAKELTTQGEAKYDAIDEGYGYQGVILEASAGHTTPKPTPSLVGRVVDVIVQRGKDVPNPQTGAPTGDYFRNYVWGAVPDAEQS